MNQYEEVQRAEQAKKLIENELFKAALIDIRAGIIEKWRSCPIRDIDGQHELKLMDKLLTDLENYIKEVINTGKMAEIQLSNEKKITELKKYGIR